ncbi:hypothetical protein BS47DRAFT_1369662 [Hydnum rufescens UP504]|uniref:Uncharacterized protein n=1 Tax=Hydnum rufescens UP504 TaxID=1448309 RepID=A0A9P6ADB9_9AGAM|nr:hypothetical protein BS47DRAFT_1369662 [Hydnum rufescens UP504]
MVSVLAEYPNSKLETVDNNGDTRNDLSASEASSHDTSDSHDARDTIAQQQYNVAMSMGITPQLPVPYQLAITLYQFGHYGSASTIEAVAQWAGCSSGVMPTNIEKQKASNWVEWVLCKAWHPGFSMVNGMIILLHCKPGHHESWAFKESEALFHEGKWLWADLAYGLASWPLLLILDNDQFNYHLSWVQICSEHAMGYLKG